MKRLKSTWRCLQVTSVLLMLLAAASATPSHASTPWWNVVSGSRPSNLSPGHARNEVQEIISADVEVFPGASGTAFELSVNHISAGIFATEPFAAFGFPEPTAENIQKALESSAFYGPGNVVVRGGPAGKEPLIIESVGDDADQPVPPVEVASVGVGTPEAKILTTGRFDGEVVLDVENAGDASVDGTSVPARITDTLPRGLKAVGATAVEPFGNTRTPLPPCHLESETLVSCEISGELAPYGQVEVRIGVVVSPSAMTGEANTVAASGGGAPEKTLSQSITVSAAPVSFGVDSYELLAQEEGGAADTQAGSHPFQITSVVGLTETGDTTALNEGPNAEPAALPKDLRFSWPAGLLGNPTRVPRCTTGEFLRTVGGEDECPADTAVGVATVTVHEAHFLGTTVFTLPVFNLEPAAGEPARFGFYVVEANAPVYIDTAVRTGGDYGVTVSTNNITQTAAFLSASVTIWGVPEDRRHDSSRGWGCLLAAHGVEHHAPCVAQESTRPLPFLSMPTNCSNEALVSSVEGDSWSDRGSFSTLASTTLPPLDGCNGLSFAPSIGVAPDGKAASTPTGLSVKLHLSQEASENPGGLSVAAIKDATVTLPPGMALNAATADGLEACSLEQFDLHGPSAPQCPDASKLGTALVKTPVLSSPLTGAVYAAAQNANPFDSLVALYLAVEDPVSGVRVKAAGDVKLDPVTGQIVTTFTDLPEAPVEDVELHFFGGDRAPLVTPGFCGQYLTTAMLAPWSGSRPVSPTSALEITSGPHGSDCPSARPFAPSLSAGVDDVQADGFTSLITSVNREDGDQPIQAAALHMPSGLTGLLSGVELCSQSDANAGTCSQESLIGEMAVSVGAGGDPFTVKGGKVYITGPYRGAPFGLSIVTPAKAGPYDLGEGACDCIVVRATISVDPHTAALTVKTDAEGPHKIPTILQGIPLTVKHIDMTVNRHRFIVNPSNCGALQVQGSIEGAEGTNATTAVPFRVTNCAALKFKPTMKVSTSARTSRSRGTSLHVELLNPYAWLFGDQANLEKVKVDLPRQLPSRLTTLQKACVAATFEANPAKCPSASIVGHAKVITPIVPVPLEGPAYFVSHGGEAFPSLTLVLQGYGITIELVGSTFIRHGVTSSTFAGIPDVPFERFDLTLPQGRYSAIVGTGNLCRAKLAMPTLFIAQNGAERHERIGIKVAGCSKHRHPHRPRHR